MGQPIGLYDGQHEHDACGVAFVATMRGTAGHDIVEHALTALRNLDHRGATGADPATGDGAGILTQIPDAFLRESAGLDLPAARQLRRRHRLPADRRRPADRWAVQQVEAIAAEEGLAVLGWRDVPVAADARRSGRARLHAALRPAASSPTPMGRRGAPASSWTGWPSACASGPSARPALYFASLSARTLVYKGMLTTGQLEPFFPDLSDRAYETELALVHSRFSTNTFPSWPLAHPYRLIAHNGEINTVKGNRNWMRAREASSPADADPRRPASGCSRSARRARATRRPSTRCSSCCTSAAVRCRTRC